MTNDIDAVIPTWHIVPSIESARMIAQRLAQLLASQDSVAWFVSGGSNVGVQAATVAELQAMQIDISRLIILLVDERYGRVGHIDSNWQKLKEAGVFIDGPYFIAPFTENEEMLEEAATRYDAIVQAILRDQSIYCVVQLGMGTDGHIAGIKPDSTAIKSKAVVCGYVHSDWKRLTVTPIGLSQMNETMLVAYGEDKWPLLEQFKQAVNNGLPLHILADIANVSVYTDYRK